jgi:hypothetical protein
LIHVGDSAVEFSRNASAGVIEGSRDLRTAAQVSSTKLAEAARYISDSNGKQVRVISTGLRAASEQVKDAVKILSKATTHFGGDNVRACEKLSVGLVDIASKLENTAIFTVGRTSQSLDALSNALDQFGSSVNAMSERHEDISKNLRMAIESGSECILSASKELRAGMVGLGEKAAFYISLTAVFIVLYLSPPLRHIFYLVNEIQLPFRQCFLNYFTAMGHVATLCLAYYVYIIRVELVTIRQNRLQTCVGDVDNHAERLDDLNQKLQLQQAELAELKTYLELLDQRLQDLRKNIEDELEKQKDVNKFIEQRSDTYITMKKANQLVDEALRRSKAS